MTKQEKNRKKGETGSGESGRCEKRGDRTKIQKGEEDTVTKKGRGRGRKMEEVSGEELAVLFNSSLGILNLCTGQIQTQGFRNSVCVCVCVCVCVRLSL